MGIIRAGACTDSSGKKYNYTIMWGSVINDAKVTYVNKQRVSFAVKYHKAPRQYMACLAWGDDGWCGSAASSLEKGDVVLCIGVWAEREWTNSQGEHKVMSELTCDFVITGAVIGYMLALLASKKINEILESGTADAMESIDDFAQEEEAPAPEEDYSLNI